MSKQSHKKTPAQTKKKAHEVYERVYNTCLSYGFTPWDENDPYKLGSALVQTARITQEKREKINELLGENLIVENLANYNPEKPHELFFRTLRQAGVDLVQPQAENEGETLTTLIDPEDMSEDELRKNFKESQQALLRTQRQLKAKEVALHQHQNDTRKLKETNKKLSENLLTTDRIYSELREQFIRPFQVALAPYSVPKRGKDQQPLVPCAILSDLHISECVEPEEVMGLSAYNPDIAEKRLKQFTEGVIEACDDHEKKKTLYQGFVLCLGGDIISGDIHEELRETNRTRTKKDSFGEERSRPASCIEASREASEMLVPVITALRDRFGVVTVLSVVGNHGRNGEKFIYKGHVHDNYDYLIGVLLEKDFANDPNVQIKLPHATDQIFDIYKWRFLLTHGDRMGVKGGDGIIGSIGPIIRGDKKTRDYFSNYGITYNYMLEGHWHKYQALSNLVVNGSLIGPSAYSSDNRLNPESPKQAFFVVHPDRGILFHHPIICDDSYRRPSVDPLVEPIPTKPDYINPVRMVLGHQGSVSVDSALIRASRNTAAVPG